LIAEGAHMRRLIRQLTGWMRPFFTPTARDRDERMPWPADPPVTRSTSPRSTPAPTVRAWCEPIDGSATHLVRPYLTAHEREEEARLQRLRRDTLWLATYGVDLDSRDIHACLGAAS
jgi:hypothetical protein